MAATTTAVSERPQARSAEAAASTRKIDLRGLRKRLEQTVTGEVRFDTGTKALYATDASNYRQVPLGVVVPKTLEDIVAVHRACHEFGAPVLPRGGGTSLSGETVNFAVVIDVSKYLTAVDEPDPEVTPLGIKGLGEIGIVGTAAAVANAIWHATGKRVRELPITIDKLL